MEELEKYLLSFKPWVSIAVLIAGIVIWKLIKHFTKGKIRDHKRIKIKEGSIQIAVNITKYIIALLVIIMILQINGVNVSAMATGLGIAGVMVGFALQDLLKDLIMGAGIVWDEFFTVGDYVKYKQYEGVVHQFNLKTTKILDVNTGSMIVVSNRNLSEIELISDWCDVNIPASYEIPAECMREICREIADRCCAIPNVKSCDFLGTDKFDNSNIQYRIRIHCKEDMKNPVRRAALGVIQDVYAGKGLTVPYEQLDVHFDKRGIE